MSGLRTGCWVSLLLLAAGSGAGQVLEGELRVSVRDATGRGVPAAVRLWGGGLRSEERADGAGRVRFARIPQGRYEVGVTQPGFGAETRVVDIRSAVPLEVEVRLEVATVESAVEVREGPPLLDPRETGTLTRAGRQQLEAAAGTTLGRSVIDAITTMPGWLLEANAVLHPRGSEYDTQYVVDGMPLYDNRSPAFAPPFEVAEMEAVSALTGGIPAEFGRRLGGVIMLDSRRVERTGGSAAMQAGPNGTAAGWLLGQWRGERSTVTAQARGGRTGRYLDPPVEENYTNSASAAGGSVRWDRTFGERDALSILLRSNRTRFLVPNTAEQEAAGQRQDRTSGETAGQVQYRRVFSARALGSAQAMVRDVDAALWSNALATPVQVAQDRGFREAAVSGGVSWVSARHSLKWGGDVRTAAIRERFVLPEEEIDFRGRRRSVEWSAFVQDRVQWGGLTAALGARVDRYRLLVRDWAASPRAAVSWFSGTLGLQLRASYDRVFQPPPMENLLLSSAATGLGLDELEGALAVPPTRGDFYEVGVRKAVGRRARIDVSHYWRRFRNFADDDVFLNTGVSFPITFESARVEGTEARVEWLGWRGWSGFASWANMTGTAQSPVTGGLFLEGGEAEELRDVARRFAISQDQRNTAAAQVRWARGGRVWAMGGWRCGSGLPFEAEDEGEGELPKRVASRVDFERGRVRPNWSVDAALGVRVWRGAQVQVSGRNLTDRLNLINFGGLFSGTALAPGRQVSVEVKVGF
ncbi:MAG: TonB-dependent receptor [Bryobacteraceae bacterium]|nr:TonB-dependent receptor [Bryobacteraceae bacterium]